MITYRDIAWFAVVTLIVVFLSKCHRDKAGIIQAQVDSLLHKSHIDQNNFENTHRADSIVNCSLSNKADSVGKQTKQYENRLMESENRALRLSNILSVYKKDTIGSASTLTLVDNGYTNYCDSLTGEVGNLAVRLNGYRKENHLLLLNKDNQIAGLDSSYRHTLVYYYECKRQFNALTDLYNKSNKVEKPRNQVFVGAELIGGPVTIIQNVGAVLSLKTTSNKLWQISGGLQSGGNWYARINGNILLSFK